jgi:hypothetical protein
MKSTSLDSEPFSFIETKSGHVRISFKGRVVTTLAGRDASRFINRVGSTDIEGAQLAWAWATGHFKHGNESAIREKGK